jgi:N-acetylneuraminic acid mutarotase
MSLSISDLGGKIIAAVATACVLGGGTVVLNGQVADGKRDEKIAQLEQKQQETLDALKEVARETSENNKKLERLIGRLEGERDGR